MIPFARIDPEFAKQQLELFLSEKYMAPNGQIPGQYKSIIKDINMYGHLSHIFSCLCNSHIAKVYYISWSF